MIKKRLMTPGPTEVHPRVQQAMNAPIINHRKEEFKALFQKTRGQLQQICKTKEPVVILAASGSGGLEAALTSLVNPGEKLLVINGGKFGQRFTDIAKTFGMIPVELTAEWGQTVPAARVAEALAGDPAIRAVCVQGSETSTGTKHDVEGIAAAVKKYPNCLLIVDGITAIGCQPIDMDGWGIDALVGGSQKAFMLPPGLAFVALSAKARAAMDKAQKPGFYFNLKKELKSQTGGETAYTPAISLVMGLNAALEVMLEQGPDDFVDNAHLQAEMTRAAAKALGLELFSANPADSCTAIRIPDAIGGANVVKTLQNEFGLYVAGGQNQLKGKIVRIAHLGYYDALDTISAVAALELTLQRLGAKVDLGAGVKAAQMKYLEIKK
jgi:aspartate aminotransferase-like enzyme